MLLAETAIFYVVIGFAVAVAWFVRNAHRSPITATLAIASAWAFWPLYLPLLLSHTTQDHAATIENMDLSRPIAVPDALALSITQVENELDAALKGLDGWAENVFSSEQRRLDELRGAWNQQAERIRQLDHLLAQPSSQQDTLAEVATANDRARQCEAVRKTHLRQLAQLRNQMHSDLIGTLAWVRELVTMIHLARFSGAPAARAEELIAQIAAAVEGLSEVSTWSDEQQLVGPAL